MKVSKELRLLALLVLVLVPLFVPGMAAAKPQGDDGVEIMAPFGFHAEYYNNKNLSLWPVLVRTDRSIDFDWGTGSPDSRVHADQFSVRWGGTLNIPRSGPVTFSMTVDDGGRLWVDGRTIIDKWFDQAATTYEATVNLSMGSHFVQMEYYENTGLAVAKLQWRPGTPTPPPPPTEIIVDDADSGFTKYGPAGWWHDDAVGYNNHIFWTRNNFNRVDNWAKWTPMLPAAGNYEVFVFIPRRHATTSNARYAVVHNNNTWDRHAVNQLIYYDQWVSLGTYYFKADGKEYVYLDDKTDEPYLSRYIGFDAVKFVRR
jgi:hypothetical protein